MALGAYESLHNLNIGKMRDVLVSSAANPGRISTSRRQRLLRSSPVASVAPTGKVAVPTSTVVRGCAFRLWYQSGFVGALGRSDDHVSGIRQVDQRIDPLVPERAPMWWMRIMGAPSK